MGKKVPPSVKIEQELYTDLLTSGDPLGEAVRRGARLVLQRAVEMEVEHFLGRGWYERSEDGAVSGHRNGYERKRVHCGEGTIELAVPQLRDTLESFESVWLKAIGTRSKRLLEMIPMLYVKGMSQRDIEAALIDALGVEKTGRSVVGEVCRSLRVDFERWQERDLSEYRLMYLFIDGIYLRLRPEDKSKVAVLAAYGMLWDGKKVLLHLAVGDKESTACWEAFFEDMKARGLNDPLLAVVDGNAGARKALRHKFPGTLVQRCQVHRMRNVLTKLPEVARPLIKKLILKAFTATNYAKGLALGKALIAEHREAFPEAMKCLERDLEECLTVLKFPFAHWRKIRTTNLLERLFGEGKRRTKTIPKFTTESSGMMLLFAVLVDASEGWRGVRMPPHVIQRLEQIAVDPDSEWVDPDLVRLAA
jgi:transposase-like protein